MQTAAKMVLRPSVALVPAAVRSALAARALAAFPAFSAAAAAAASSPMRFGARSQRQLHVSAARALPLSGPALLRGWSALTTRPAAPSTPLPAHVLVNGVRTSNDPLRDERRLSAEAAASAAATATAASSVVPDPRDLAATLDKVSRAHAANAKAFAERQEAEAAAPKGKLKQLWHDYGYVGIGTYLGVYVGTLGMMYVAISSGALGGDVVLWFVDKLGMASHFSADISPKSSSFLLAWVATKLTEPPRLALAVILTPYVARLLGRAPAKQSVAQIAKVAAGAIKEQVKKH